MATPPYASKDRLRESNEPSRLKMVTKQKAAEELQYPGAGAASSSKHMEVVLQYADKLLKSSRNGAASSSNMPQTLLGVRCVKYLEKFSKYTMLTCFYLKGRRKMCSPKFNNEQCRYLIEKLEAIAEVAEGVLLFLEEYRQSSDMFSILDMERWEEIFKLFRVSSKQVEGFIQDCCKDEWIHVAMTLSNVGEYVSSIGFNLELCKVALYKWEGVTKYYTLKEVVGWDAYEVESVKSKALDDTDTLLKKVKEELHTLNAQDVELVTYLKLKLEGDVGNPSFVEDNSNVLLKLFSWVRNMGKREELIATGASAKVYKVNWFGIPVAKKTFEGPENPEFLQETKVLSQLHHPNITSMFCCNVNKKEGSIIMELMDGSLYDLLSRKQGEDDKFIPFSNVEGLNLMLQIGEGVEYLHRNKIAHRDLKSANILVKRLESSSLEVVYMQLKVADFGLSKRKEVDISLSPMTFNVGSSRWMAPEIIKFFNNENVLWSSKKLPKYNFKGDIYSFGMVCYEILVGKIPFESEVYDRNVKEMVLRGLRPSLPEYCPPRLAKLIQQCWNHDPKERPSVGDICAELKYLKYLLLMRTHNESVQIEAIDDNVEIDAIKDQEAQADAWVRVSDDSNPAILKSRLEEASMKEHQLVSEKRILERHNSELRLAYDQQQHALEEILRLTNALQVAEQERATYMQNLMPLLAEFDLQPPVSDAHSMVKHIKILLQRLRSESDELHEIKMKDPHYYQQSYQPPYQPSQSYNTHGPQSPTFHQSNGLEPSYSQKPASSIQQLGTGRPSWARSRDPDAHLACSNEQKTSVDAGAIVPRDSVNSRPNEGLDDSESDDLLYNGASSHETLSLGRPDVNRPASPPLPSIPEEPNSPSFEGDPLPGVVGLRIVGDAVLGRRLIACGDCINGTSLCIFQWVRHYQDGTAAMIEGAEQPDYNISADDIECVVAVEFVPMDDRGRRGDLVTVMVNNGSRISRDPMMQDQINNYMTNGQATFALSLLIKEGTSEDVSEPATLVLRRSNFELKRNNGRKVTINEKYTPEILMKIPCGELLRCVISKKDGSKEHFLELRDPRMRDMAVLTFRAFHKAAMDEKMKKRN